MNAPTSIADPLAGHAVKALSRFETACLLRRTCECDELLQLSVLGVEGAIERHGGDASLRLIAEFLRDAEYAVQQARRLVLEFYR